MYTIKRKVIGPTMEDAMYASIASCSFESKNTDQLARLCSVEVTATTAE